MWTPEETRGFLERRCAEVLADLEQEVAKAIERQALNLPTIVLLALGRIAPIGEPEEVDQVVGRPVLDALTDATAKILERWHRSPLETVEMKRAPAEWAGLTLQEIMDATLEVADQEASRAQEAAAAAEGD